MSESKSVDENWEWESSDQKIFCQKSTSSNDEEKREYHLKFVRENWVKEDCLNPVYDKWDNECGEQDYSAENEPTLPLYFQTF
jgi:hypothetical protein